MTTPSLTFDSSSPVIIASFPDACSVMTSALDSPSSMVQVHLSGRYLS